jgi:type VI secretion system protein ImpF
MLRPDERLKPSLLDRLTDDEPTESREALRLRFASARSLRESVVRDLGWLLNSVRLSTVQELAAFPYAASSALNFGLPDLAGRTISSIDVPALEAEIRKAIISYEPRLVPQSVHVSVQDSVTELGINSMQFTIEAMLMSYPAPLVLCLRTEIDLETGDVTVMEWDNGRQPAASEASVGVPQARRSF